MAPLATGHIRPRTRLNYPDPELILLGLYTFGCHSFRHLIGGRKDALSGSPVRKSCYDCVSGLNRKHMLWAWISMFYVGFVDLYIRLCAKGIWTDWRIF